MHCCVCGPRSHHDEMSNSVVFELLLSLGDFDIFKKFMLAYNKAPPPPPTHTHTHARARVKDYHTHASVHIVDKACIDKGVLAGTSIPKPYPPNLGRVGNHCPEAGRQATT